MPNRPIAFNCVTVNDECQNLVTLASKFSSNIIKEIEEWSETLPAELDEIILLEATTDEPIVREITVTLTVPDSDDLMRELSRLESL